VLVVSFVFTTCREACPLITAQLARVQARARAEKLDARVRFVSITLDPATDTPEALRRYAAAYGIDLASWHLLTGAPDDVTRVIRAFGLATVAGDRIAHGSLGGLVDASSRSRRSPISPASPSACGWAPPSCCRRCATR